MLYKIVEKPARKGYTSRHLFRAADLQVTTVMWSEDGDRRSSCPSIFRNLLFFMYQKSLWHFYM